MRNVLGHCESLRLEQYSVVVRRGSREENLFWPGIFHVSEYVSERSRKPHDLALRALFRRSASSLANWVDEVRGRNRQNGSFVNG